jgi:Kip1 ubiquitination-promoting complex protein 1
MIVFFGMTKLICHFPPYGAFRYRATLFSQWKQRGMYATCMWVVELLLVLSNSNSMFHYVPEFYVESLVGLLFSLVLFFLHSQQIYLAKGVFLLPLQVDCFHALRRSDPPFVSPSLFLMQGLASFVCTESS